MAKLVQLPKRTKKEMDVLTEEECEAFMNALKGERLEPQNATVRRAVIRLPKREWYFAEPKTKSSRRAVPLPATLIKELRAHRRKQNKERLKLGAAWQNHDLVFPSEVGTHITHSNIT